MKFYDSFGINRVLEPKGSLPQTAWKLDNTMVVHDNEILVDVQIISINLVSFYELGEETKYKDDAFKHRILEIIQNRGKLHNPVTSTGGICFGTVAKIGAHSPNPYGVKVGDEIISLMSLSLIPLKIDKIISVNYESAQMKVVGQCILFGSAPLVKRPKDLPIQQIVTCMDEAGAPKRTYNTVTKGHDVLIMGANGKIGLLCSYAARDKLGKTGRLVGIVKTEKSKKKLNSLGIFDAIYCMNSADVIGFYTEGHKLGITEQYDIVINCINSPNTEMASLMCVKPFGILYFASLSSDYKLASLTAESLSKDVTLIPYSGFVRDHANYTLDLLRRYQGLQDALSSFVPGEIISPSEEEYESANDHNLGPYSMDGHIFYSKESQETFRQALRVAHFNSNIIICGESGVGKEVIARIIHQNSDCRSFPMIKINCASIPENLLESELFGYEKGSFTGAGTKGKVGLWETAQNGTLFLDEISELPLSFQAKILRAIQEKEIVRVGGISPIRVNVRIIAATNRNLSEMIKLQQFREDLYYRLNVFPIYVRPLRERKADIVPLIKYFVEKYNREFSMEKSINSYALSFLSAQPFRGNIRELQNLIQRLMIITEGQTVEIQDILQAIAFDRHFDAKCTTSEDEKEPSETEMLWLSDSAEKQTSLKELLSEREHAILVACKKKYKTSRKIAKVLGLSQSSVVRKLNQYNIED